MPGTRSSDTPCLSQCTCIAVSHRYQSAKQDKKSTWRNNSRSVTLIAKVKASSHCSASPNSCFMSITSQHPRQSQHMTTIQVRWPKTLVAGGPWQILASLKVTRAITAGLLDPPVLPAAQGRTQSVERPSNMVTANRHQS